MMADISQVVNVALIPEGQQASFSNMNVCTVFTSEQGVIASAERFRTYRDAAAVAADWGSASSVTEYANTFFGTKPNAVNFSGSFVVALHRATTENVAATAATLVSAQMVEATVIDTLQTITDGSFTIDVDGTPVIVTGLDFTSTIDLDGVATILDTAIAGATVAHDNGFLTVTSGTTGVLSLLTAFEAHTVGTFIGEILSLSDGSGSTLTQGAAAVVLPIETKVESLTATKALINFKGSCFIDLVLDAEVPDIAAWASANETIVYNVFSGSSYLLVDPANPVWAVRLASQSNFRCLYSKSGNRKLAVSYMARTHTVNFNAENSAITMHLKTLNVPAESYTQTEITAAKRVGLDLYVTIKDVPVVLTSHVNGFVDNVYNLIAYVDAIQIENFNLLKATGTKIPQTTKGVNQLVATNERATRRFVRAGVFAPGTWSSPDSFGNIDTFNRNIEQFGFYVLAGLLKDQPQVDRQQRKSPVIEIAVKNAGGIHSVDVIIRFNA